jgi:hypothetical protein
VFKNLLFSNYHRSALPYETDIVLVGFVVADIEDAIAESKLLITD